jgi:hypothetical protein
MGRAWFNPVVVARCTEKPAEKRAFSLLPSDCTIRWLHVRVHSLLHEKQCSSSVISYRG